MKKELLLLIEQYRLSFGLWLMCKGVAVMPKDHEHTAIWRRAMGIGATNIIAVRMDK
jgi:hypothetical protein